MLFFFFFQAEDGIRDIGVTGVQTCALPISELHVDVIEAAQADGFPALATRLDAFRKVRGAETLTLAVRPGLLRGGDAPRGLRVITDNPAADCARCHTLGGQGA